MLKELATVAEPTLDATTGAPLMAPAKFDEYIAGEGKGLILNNYLQKIDENSEYRGQWAADRKTWTGLGEIKYGKSGNYTEYTGFTKDKLYQGPGRLTSRTGEIYQGEFHKGVRSGVGAYLSNTETGKSLYKGGWKNGKKHGPNGKESWNQGNSVYTGEFKDGVKSGKGKFVHNGNIYEGDFVNGLYHGHGKYYYADTGRVYEGEFINNHSDGKGVMVWPDGSRYEGNFVGGRMEGSGTLQ